MGFVGGPSCRPYSMDAESDRYLRLNIGRAEVGSEALLADELSLGARSGCRYGRRVLSRCTGWLQGVLDGPNSHPKRALGARIRGRACAYSTALPSRGLRSSMV